VSMNFLCPTNFSGHPRKVFTKGESR